MADNVDNQEHVSLRLYVVAECECGTRLTLNALGEAACLGCTGLFDPDDVARIREIVEDYQQVYERLGL